METTFEIIVPDAWTPALKKAIERMKKMSRAIRVVSLEIYPNQYHSRKLIVYCDPQELSQLFVYVGGNLLAEDVKEVILDNRSIPQKLQMITTITTGY